jgi:hypothetical protein
MSKKSILQDRKWTAVLFTLLFAGLLWGVYQDMDAWFRPQLVHATRLSFGVLAAFLFEGSITIGVMVAIWRPGWLKPLRRLRNQLGVTRWVLLILFAIVGGYFFRYEKIQMFDGQYARISLMVFFLGVASWLATEEDDFNWSWKGLLAGSLIFASAFLYAVRLLKVSNHPFSLYWSEGNRIWDYSIPFGRRLYNYPPGEEIFSLTDIGRRSLWGIPYLLPGVQIWMVRFWDVLMFTVPYVLLGWAVFSEERKKNGWLYLFLGLWTMLFLNQGPIYSPLVLAALVVVLGRKTPYWLNVVLVLIASYYARTSRYTWMFAPGIWAAMLAFLDQDWSLTKSWVQKWLQPILLGVTGVIGGYVLPELVILLTGKGRSQADLFTVEGMQQTTGRQPLLWDRLLPNATYAPGILLGLVLAVVPLIILLFSAHVGKIWKLHFWQKLAGTIFMSMFLGVGVVISTKIGGGSNLHNLDMFLIGLVLLAGLAWKNGGQSRLLVIQNNSIWMNIAILALVMLPAVKVIREPGYSQLPPPDLVAEALAETQSLVAEARKDGDVLFMDQRQLITFGHAGDVPLIAEYEKKKLMEEAMASNAGYFDAYYQDLASHRFALIVSEPLRAEFQGAEFDFGNENDAWVRWVSIPMLCYYEPVAIYHEVGLELLVPRREVTPPVDGAICP